DQEGGAGLLDPPAAEPPEGGIHQRLVQAQEPLRVFPGGRAHPVGVTAEAREDDGEVLGLHVGQGRQGSPVGHPQACGAIYVSTAAPPARWATTSSRGGGRRRSSGSIRS